jgi:hypothetical protein
VNHAPPFQTQKGGARRKAGSREKGTQQGNIMVFGDNVRARKAARALPRTPTAKGREEGKEERERRRRQQRDHTHLTRHRHSTTHNTPQH